MRTEAETKQAGPPAPNHRLKAQLDDEIRVTGTRHQFPFSLPPILMESCRTVVILPHLQYQDSYAPTRARGEGGTAAP